MSRFPSPLRYPGGKQKQAKWLKNYFPQDIKDYREIFVGGGGVGITLLREKNISRSLFNDFDEGVFSFWLSAKRNTDQDHRYLHEVLTAKKLHGVEHIKENYWDHIVKHADTSGVNYLLRNKMSYNGLKTFSKLACEKNFGQSTIDRWELLGKDLKNTTLVNDDYEVAMGGANSDTWVYADPPYISASQNLYKGHAKFDHERLARVLTKYKDKGVNIVISYDDTPEIRELYKDWFIYDYQWSYSMTNNKKSGVTTKGKELVITSFEREEQHE